MNSLAISKPLATAPGAPFALVRGVNRVAASVLAAVPRPYRRALTLIEILAVAGVLALLMGMLLPALGQAREAGRGSVCIAVLHNAGVAANLYFEDNDGSFWPYYEDVPNPDGGRRWWFGFEPGGPPTNPSKRFRFLDKSAGFVGRYMAAADPDLICPSFPYSFGRYFPKFAPAAGGYGYNIAALAGGQSPLATGPRKIQEFTGRTSDIFLLADGIHFDKLSLSGSAALDQSFNEPAYIQWQPPELFNTPAGVNGGFAHFRHNRRASVVYLDGHAAAQPPRRTLHPVSAKGYGPVANLSDDSLRTRDVVVGGTTRQVDLIYGLP